MCVCVRAEVPTAWHGAWMIQQLHAPTRPLFLLKLAGVQKAFPTKVIGPSAQLISSKEHVGNTSGIADMSRSKDSLQGS